MGQPKVGNYKPIWVDRFVDLGSKVQHKISKDHRYEVRSSGKGCNESRNGLKNGDLMSGR